MWRELALVPGCGYDHNVLLTDLRLWGAELAECPALRFEICPCGWAEAMQFPAAGIEGPSLPGWPL